MKMIKDLLISLCECAGKDKLLKFSVSHRMVEGEFADKEGLSAFRMLVDSEGVPIMATVEYALIERTYGYREGKWIML